MNELNKRVAIIFGASKGIGAATAKHLAALGISVVIGARSKTKLEKVANEIRMAGGSAQEAVCDVSQFEDVKSLVDLTLTRYGKVDVVINCAGIIDPISSLADSDPEQWCKVVDINYKGVFFAMRAVLPVMRKQRSGVIINISSGAATSALEGWSHYCSSKAAVLSLTRCADKENREFGIRVTGLSPGTVATDMQRSIKSSGINPVSQLDWQSHIPVEWPAKAVAYLCTDSAKDLGGQDFSIKTEQGRKRVGLN